MIAYKLFRVKKDGSITSLFINKSVSLKTNRWLRSQSHPTPGFAVRPGWHTVAQPEAPHLSLKNRAWYRVELKDYQTLVRPKSQGRTWFLAKRMRILDRIESSKINCNGKIKNNTVLSRSNSNAPTN